MKSWLCELILSCTVATQVVPTPADLQYGVVLYDYYQDEYQSALVEALVAETRGRRGDNTVRFELAKGSFAFAARMFDYADTTFSAIDPKELTELDRQRLAFHLAREYFRRGDWPLVEKQLAVIDLGKTWLGRERRHPEVEFMRAELASQRGDFDAALANLEAVPVDSRLHAYALFNIGVGLRAAGQPARAAEVLKRLAELEVFDTEALDLKERARLALSFVERELEHSADAETVLTSLPAAGRYRDLALTSYGGLAMETGNYELAARVWMSLKDEGYWTPSTAAARLAFPLSLEQLASKQSALAQYRVAEQSYEARLASLDTLSTRANDPAWVNGILRVFTADETDPDDANAALNEWRAQLGHTDWLEWLSTEDVHELMLEWRELDDTMRWLDRMPEELAIFEELAGEQRRRTVEARHLIETEGLAERREQMARTIEEIDARTRAAQSAVPMPHGSWMEPLAKPDEAKLFESVAAMRGLLERAHAEGKGALTKGIEDRVARIEGIVFWQVFDDAPARVRELQKANRANRELLADVDARLVRVARAEQSFVAGVETDFLTFQARADDIAADVRRARATREEMLAEQLRGGMRRERAQVEKYLLLTRIAIARSMDQIALGGDGGATIK